MESIIDRITVVSPVEGRLLVRRLKSMAEHTGLELEELDAVVAFGGENESAILERRARHFDVVLTVAGRLLADDRAVGEWLRKSNPALLGMSPLHALTTHEDALRAIRRALVAEHRDAYPDGGI